MSLSNYQGSYMNIHFARKKRNDGALGKEELRVLREKAKNGDQDAANKLSRFRGESLEKKVVEPKKNKKIVYGKLAPLTRKEKIRIARQNDFYGKESVSSNDSWESMQERTNNLALELLKNAKNKE